jgi:Family of unknown function (DUF6953)
MASVRDVAEWMVRHLNTESYLTQEHACFEIRKRFGEQFTSLNAAGDTAVAKHVLREFRKLADLDVVWSRRERTWRKGSGLDEPGHQRA